MSAQQIAQRATEMGYGSVWTTEKRAEVAKQLGINWSARELATLFEYYPLRKPNSNDWLIDLFAKTGEERLKAASLLGIPSHDQMETLKSHARKLFDARKKARKAGR